MQRGSRGEQSPQNGLVVPLPQAQGPDKSINRKSKAAGRGAERLASTTARGVYDRSLPGHSVSQGSMGALVPGQSSWIEEREVEVQHDTGSAAPQQIVLQSAENAEDGNLHAIPKKLSTRQRLMLETTQADEERGAVSAIKCKLCPSAGFSSWETFKRHCKTCEKHPAELRFCPRCGDYFARPDSGKRHRKDDELKKKCRNTRPEWAREKKQNVKRLLREFEASLGHRLRNGGDITLSPSSRIRRSRIPRRRYPNGRRPGQKTTHGPLDCIRDAICIPFLFSSFRQSHRVRLQCGDTDDIISSMTYIHLSVSASCHPVVSSVSVHGSALD
jgi:hypothetical protein